MPVSDDYLSYIRERLDYLGNVRIRKMFGGAMVYLDSLPFALIADDELYIRAGNGNRNLFQQAGMDMFKPYANKPMTMPYGEVPGDVIEDDELLRVWIMSALDAAREAKK